MQRAQEVRARYHDPNHATYMVMRIINYTNVCVAQCDYCAFYVLPNQEGGYVLSREDVFEKIDELLEVGGDLVGFNGGFNPRLPLDYYCDLFASVRERYGERVEFYALTIAEFVFLADRAKLSYTDAAARLRDAGVHWITGGGSEILTEDFRAGTPSGSTRSRLLRGAARDRRERAEDDRHDGDRLRRDARRAARAPAAHARVPGRSGGWGCSRSCAGRTSRTAPRSAAARSRRGSTGATSRSSRIFLDNVKHIRTSVLTQNEDAFRALDFGADDFDLPIEDEVTQKAGARIDLDLEGLLDVPRSLGYTVEYRRAERPAALRRSAYRASGGATRTAPRLPGRGGEYEQPKASQIAAMMTIATMTYTVHVRLRRRRHLAVRAQRPGLRGRFAAATKRSSGTRSSSPTSRANSRNVSRPARSRGPNE